jgi:hypothetical protein
VSYFYPVRFHTGLAYESVMLYAHALQKLKTDGDAYTNGEKLMAALRGPSSVTVTGANAVVHTKVALDNKGEMDTPYHLFNFDGPNQGGKNKWFPIGNWSVASPTLTSWDGTAGFSRMINYDKTNVVYPDSTFIKLGACPLPP